MSILNLPSVTDTLAESGLTEGQVSVAFKKSDVQSAVATNISEAASAVEGLVMAATSPEPFPFTDEDLEKALPKYSQDQRAARLESLLSRLQLAVKWWALSILYRRSGQLNSAYSDKADEYAAKANMLLTGSEKGDGTGGLLGELGSLSDAISAGVVDNPDDEATASSYSSSVPQVLVWG